MNAFILADISDVMQKAHPVFGIPLGLCLLLFVLFKVFSSNQAPPPPKDDFQSFRPVIIPPKEEKHERLKCNEGVSILFDSFASEMRDSLSKLNYAKLDSNEALDIEKVRLKRVLKVTIARMSEKIVSLETEEGWKGSQCSRDLNKCIEKLSSLYGSQIDSYLLAIGYLTDGKRDGRDAITRLIETNNATITEVGWQISELILNNRFIEVKQSD